MRGWDGSGLRSGIGVLPIQAWAIPVLAIPMATLALLPTSLTAQQAVDEAPVAPESSIVATWNGGRLERADHESWRSFHELGSDHAAIQEHVLQESLAAAARERSAPLETRTRLEVEAMRQGVLMAALRQHLVAGMPDPGREEIDRLAQERPDAFRRPRKLQLSSLYKRFGDGRDTEAVRARMLELHRELLAGADFEALARSESESQSRLRGGRLGFVDPDELPPRAAAAVRDLAPGQLTEPVEHGEGISIFRCDSVREGSRPTPDELRRKLETNLVRLRGRELWQAARERLLEESGAEVTPGAATTVLAMNGYRLDRSDLPELVAVRAPGVALGSLDTEAVSSLLRDWAVGVAGARRAVELGLDLEPEVATILRWRTLSILARRELERRVEARLSPPSEAEVRQRFETAARPFSEPESFDLAVIQLSSESEESVALARSIERLLASGELRFDEAARRHSIHPSAPGGGRLGWVDQRQVGGFGPRVVDAIRELEPGAWTDLLHLETGLWIFELRDYRQSRRSSFEDARDRVRANLLQEQTRRLERVLREEELARIGLSIVQ